MKLDLDELERTDLEAALDVQLRSLRAELVHTDDRSYRRSVRERLDRLEKVGDRVARGRAERPASTNGKTVDLWAKNVMHTHPLTALPEDLVLEVGARMAEHGVRHMPVVDRGGRLVGIVSDRDVRQAIGTPLRLSADGVLPEALTTLSVEAIMTREPVSLVGDASLLELARIFAEKPIGAVPIVDGDARVIGIISYMDVISKLATG